MNTKLKKNADIKEQYYTWVATGLYIFIGNLCIHMGKGKRTKNEYKIEKWVSESILNRLVSSILEHNKIDLDHRYVVLKFLCKNI